MGIKKNVLMTVYISSALLAATLPFTNCSKMGAATGSGSLSSMNVVATSTQEEQKLIEVLNKAADRAAYLTNLDATLADKENRETQTVRRNSLAGYRRDLAKTVASLNQAKDKILNLLQVQRLSISSNAILSQTDFLILALAEAYTLQVEIELNEKISEVDKASKERDAAMQAKIDKLEEGLTATKADIDKFKAQVNARFKSLDEEIGKINARLSVLDKLIAEYKASSDAADIALGLALADLRKQSEAQIIQLTDLNSKLKEDIVAQKKILDELFKADASVASIAGRLCAVDAKGDKTDARAQCSGSEANLYTTAVCCLNVHQVDCTVMFPSEVQGSARNQCNILVATVRNHDEQLKAIRQVDDKQTSLIEGLLKDVENISQQLTILADGYSLLQQQVNLIAAKLLNVDKRLMIVEFKAARAEAAATLMERADLNAAWIARRSADVSARFCSANVRQALDQFDYEAARQNWHYCHERLEFLTRASELNNLSRAYINGLQSVNVDSSCSATVAGKPAEQLSNQELLVEANYKEVMAKCTTGGEVVVRALILNVVQLQGVIGPDFRTINYMMKKAKIGQLAYLGKVAADTSAQERADFENVDPTDAKIAKTLYGRIERPFQKRYVENRMRTLAGTFPERPSDIPENISGFNTIWSHSQIKNDSAPYFRRLAALELKGDCADCGFQVAGRVNTDVAINRGGKERFSYPKDTESLCPVMNDIVVLKNADGKFYPYKLNYDGMREDFTGYLRGGSHVAIAGSEADAANGNFAYCGRHGDYLVSRNGLDLAQLKSRLMVTVTNPYGNVYAGRGSCKHSTVVCVMRDEEWVTPTANFDFASDKIGYLNGYSAASVTNQCKFNMGSQSRVRTIALDASYKNRIHTFPSMADAASLQLRSTITDSTTQLTSNYWTLRDNVLNYGVNNASVSKTNPFFGSNQSHSDQFVRVAHKLTKDVSVQECTPNEP